MKMTIFRRAVIPGRRIAMATAILATAGLLASVSVAPASAAPARAAHASTMGTKQASAAADPYEECLTNTSTNCVGLIDEVVVAAGTVITIYGDEVKAGVKVAAMFIKKVWIRWVPGPGSHKLWAGYYEFDGDSAGAGANTNLCLGDTSFTAPITLKSCGANGTVWIEEPDNNGGNYNFNEYFVDNTDCEIASPGYTSYGDCRVMSANSLQDGAALYLDRPEQSGGGLFQDWNP